MNVIFVTQGGILKVFFDLLQCSRAALGIEKAGFYVADSVYYKEFAFANPEFEKDCAVLREWEVLKRALAASPDPDYLDDFEKRAGDPGLWTAVYTDRRLVNGPFCKVTQDYKPRFKHDELKLIVQETARAIEKLLDEIQPDIMIAFVPVTFGDYLFWLAAKSRGIKYLHFKSTKIINYITMSESIHESPLHIYATISEYEKCGGPDEPWGGMAREYLSSAREKQVTYEGIVKRQVDKGPVSSSLKAARFLPGAAKSEIAYRIGPASKDNQVPPPLGTFYYREYVQPARTARMKEITAPRTIAPEKLESIDYIFYPMHSEPEIALSVYGRPYLNQIELIRNIAMSIPISQHLVLKEHPRSKGFRTEGYYKRLMEIPNVCFVPVSTPPRMVVKHSRAICIVSGFIGLEALMMGRPVLTFGQCPFNILEGPMLSHVRDLWSIGDALRKLIDGYQYDEETLINYIAATMKNSVPVNLYSTLLAKSGRQSFGEDSYEEHIKLLAEYFVKRCREVTQ